MHLQYQVEVTTHIVISSVLNANERTLSILTLLSSQQQATRHSNLLHDAADEPQRVKLAQEWTSRQFKQQGEPGGLAERQEACRKWENEY